MAELLFIRAVMKRVISFLLCCVPFVSQCSEKPADLDNPKRYNKHGLEFQYPGNWEITKDSRISRVRTVFVESPGDALVIIQVYPPDLAIDLKDFVKNFSDAARDEMPVGSFSKPVFDNEVLVHGHKTINERFDTMLAGQRVPHVRLYERIVSGGTACFLVAQVADEDRSRVINGFGLVFSSFKFLPE